MNKELLVTIDETIENICKWTNEKFKPKKISNRDMMMRHIDGNDESTDENFDEILRIIDSLSKLLQVRANLENILTNDMK